MDDDQRPVVELRGVFKGYQPLRPQVIRDAQLVVRRGEMVFLCGASGAGKSTLVHLMLGHELADRGEVRLWGWDLGRVGRGRLARLRRRIGVVFQDFRLLEGMSALENVALALRIRGVRGRALQEMAMAALRWVGLEEAAGVRVEFLSGGEQQRVALARALAGGPRLVLADEPTGNLDPQNARVVMGLLARARAGGAAVVVATHDPGLPAMVVGGRVVKIIGGRLVEEQ